VRYNAFLSLGIPKTSVSQHEAIIKALEEQDLEKLKLSIKENIIYPKMIYESRKPKSPSKDLVNGLLHGQKEES
jgi:DNA-binding GntR family transcriptional regulator